MGGPKLKAALHFWPSALIGVLFSLLLASAISAQTLGQTPAQSPAQSPAPTSSSDGSPQRYIVVLRQATGVGLFSRQSASRSAVFMAYDVAR
jgi:hypothetical protein